jgi:hypothetical protein
MSSKKEYEREINSIDNFTVAMIIIVACLGAWASAVLG